MCVFFIILNLVYRNYGMSIKLVAFEDVSWKRVEAKVENYIFTELKF